MLGEILSHRTSTTEDAVCDWGDTRNVHAETVVRFPAVIS